MGLHQLQTDNELHPQIREEFMQKMSLAMYVF